MRKLMTLAAILAMVVASAVPALGQSSSVSNKGNLANTCVGEAQQSNKGNIEDEEQSVEQTDSKSDDISIEGSQMNFEAQAPTNCTQTVGSATAAS